MDHETSEAEARHPYVGEDMLSLDDSYEVEGAFQSAAKEFAVPIDLLKAIAYVESKGDHHHGVKTPEGAFGVMGLRETKASNTLDEAAKLLRCEKAQIVRDPVQNIRAAAALLREYYQQAVRAKGASKPWLVALTLYSGREPQQAVVYAREIENILHEGLVHTTGFGQQITIQPKQDPLLSTTQP